MASTEGSRAQALLHSAGITAGVHGERNLEDLIALLAETLSLGGHKPNAKEVEQKRTLSRGEHSVLSQTCDAESQTPAPNETEAMREAGHLPLPSIVVHGAFTTVRHGADADSFKIEVLGRDYRVTVEQVFGVPEIKLQKLHTRDCSQQPGIQVSVQSGVSLTDENGLAISMEEAVQRNEEAKERRLRETEARRRFQDALPTDLFL